MTGTGWRAEVREALRRDALRYAEHLFGPAKGRPRRDELRFAGSNCVVIAGPKAGAWTCWAAGASGGLIEATAHQYSLGFDEALRYAAQWAGIRLDDDRPPPRRRIPDIPAQAGNQRDAEAARIAKARAIWVASVPLAGTLGDRYLREARRIPAPAGGWPDGRDAHPDEGHRPGLRWHPGKRAVVAAATNEAVELTAVHCVYLDRHGRNVRRDGKKLKLSFGLVKGAVVRLPATTGRADLRQFGEGLETALSGWCATGHETHVVLGGLARAVPQPGYRNILLRDDDAIGSPADTALLRAVDGWRDRGLEVALATPWPERRGDKSDFNDLLQAEGLAAVEARIRCAELALDAMRPAVPPFAASCATLTELRQKQRDVIRNYLRQRFRQGALPPLLIDGTTGSGKTEEIVAWLPTLVRDDKQLRRSHRVVIFTPTIRHGRDLITRIAEADAEADPQDRLRVEIYRGRVDETCRNMSAIALARQAGAELGRSVCGQGSEADQCPHRDGCAYFAQLAPAATADVLIVAHNFLFEPLPRQLVEGVSLVVIDEDFTGHGDEITEASLRLFERTEAPVLVKGQPDDAGTIELDELLGRIRRVLETPGPLAAAAAEAGLTRADLSRTRKLSWRRKVDPGMSPGMSLADRRAAAADAAINADLKLVDIVTRALEEIALEDDGAPPLGLDPEAGRVEVTAGIATVYGLRKLAGWLRDLPTLILSATASPARLRRFFPNLEHPHLPRPSAPHQTIHQHIGAFGTRKLGMKIEDLALDFRQLIGDRRALVTAPQAHTAALRHALPPGARIGHHGNIAGDDSFGDVEVEIVLGGRFLSPLDTARRASCEHGRVISPGRIEKIPAVALMTDGTGVEFDRAGYTDPRLQAMLRQTYDADIIQAIGRARGINRTAVNPVEIHVFANLPLPYPVTSISRWRRPDRVARMVDAGIVATNAADAALLRPDLYPTPGAAEKGLYRAGGAAGIEARTRALVALRPEAWVRARYQHAGQGYKPAVALVAADRVETLRQQLGRLARFEVSRFTPGTRPEKTRTPPISETYTGLSGSSPDQPACRVSIEPETPVQPPRPPPDG